MKPRMRADLRKEGRNTVTFDVLKNYGFINSARLAVRNEKDAGLYGIGYVINGIGLQAYEIQLSASHIGRVWGCNRDLDMALALWIMDFVGSSSVLVQKFDPQLS